MQCRAPRMDRVAPIASRVPTVFQNERAALQDDGPFIRDSLFGERDCSSTTLTGIVRIGVNATLLWVIPEESGLRQVRVVAENPVLQELLGRRILLELLTVIAEDACGI